MCIRDRPDSVLPTLGGQAGLNLAMEPVSYTHLGAELYELTGRRDEAMACLKECKEQILEQRSRYPSYYCLFQYVLLKLQPDRERGESLKRLISKYVDCLLYTSRCV